jgi:dTDP-4-dehydrorhamnose 3,5-epimerase
VKTVATELPGVLVVEADVWRDQRGFFLETYHAPKFKALGISATFVQDNHSRSTRGTLRGLHLQVSRPQAKLIRVIAGEIFDVAVDVRRGSPTFGRWVGIPLSAESFRQVYVPEGFAHGFAVTSDIADVVYKCTEVYDPAGEVSILWNDPELAIGWPVSSPVLSDRDRSAPPIAQVVDRLLRYAPGGLANS